MRCAALYSTVLVLSLAACSERQEGPAEAPAPEPNATAAGAGEELQQIEAAIAAERLPGDREQDSWRKPDVVLAFLEVRPGMRVVDYLAAGGYYAELLSRIVGPQGQVIAYNNPPYLEYSKDVPQKRYGEDRLANVAQLTTAPEEAPFEPNSIDAVLFVQSYHDLHWRAKDGSWPQTDPGKSLAALVPALKPGAVVVVLDHAATAGSDPAESVDALHRIDPEIVKRDFENAGLEFVDESDAFRNPADDHAKPVFDESIRRKTDQFMFKFRKP